ncbi:MAG: hypothetical protein ACYDGY_08680 [Acidimicrobiales bacterium]
MTGNGFPVAPIAQPPLPSVALFDAVSGQERAVELLRASARNPVHAYLLLGPAGLCQRELWRGFAASILCPDGGCGQCEWCTRCLRGTHPDLNEIENSGLTLSVDEAHDLVRLAQRTPLLAARQVLVVQDITRARLAAPVLLKTLEEPPRRTVFVLTADSVPSDLATIRSRCLSVELVLPQPHLLDTDGSESPGTSSPSSHERMAASPEDPLWDLWTTVPSRIEPVGSSIAAMADGLLASVEQSVSLLQSRHTDELKEHDDHEASVGTNNRTLRNRIIDRHRRELRREKIVSLRKGLLVLQKTYQDQLVEVAGHSKTDPSRNYRMRTLSSAIDAIDYTAAQLVRNPNETLLLQSLLLKLANA